VTVINQWWYDPGWKPLLVTPPFPSYPSGHATTSAAAAAVLGHFFPTARERPRRMADEAAQSRLYAGIHFPSDTRAGLVLGRQVAGAALRRVSSMPHQGR
jgi:membrane-associated phospholipid phosphatase